MKRSNRITGKIKLVFVALFAIAGALVLIGGDERVIESVAAFSKGPPVGHTGGPGESTCAVCHFGASGPGTFTITQPANYTPGQTYQIVVRHTSTDATRDRWGFQLTALTGANAMAGSFANISAFTQVVEGTDRDYAEHTLEGTFNGTTNQAQWTFNWTAPATNVGPVTFYAAGNQANGDGTADGDRILTTNAVTPPGTVTPPADGPFDFDGDGRTDIGIYRPTPSEWWINRSLNGQTFALQFGANGDMIAPGDFTGDGKDDITIWRPSTGFWFILRSEDFSFFGFPFGATGDIPVPADFDADGKADPTVFRPSSTLWFVARTGGEGTLIVQFGLPGDHPVPADYDGDDKADIAVRRPNAGNSEWWVSRSTAGPMALVFGADNDIGVPGDYTGDGKADIAFWRPSTGFWFILRSEDLSFFAFPFGATGDIPAPGEYDGDGKWDVAVFRPTDTNWYIGRSTGGTQILQFGAAGDKPIPNAYVR